MSKFVNKKVETLQPSGIRLFFDLVLGMKDVISLGVGEPDFVTPWNIREAGIFSLEQGFTSYTSNKGLYKLRLNIHNFLKKKFSLEYDPEEEILITVGVSEGLDLVIRSVVDRNDKVIIPLPSYVSYGPMVSLAGGEPLYIPTTEKTQFKITPLDIEKAMDKKPKAIILNYPANPSGASYTKKELEELKKVIAKHKLLCITDEVYDELTYDFSHTPFATLAGAKEYTVYLNGFSKSYAMTGWRVGYACGPKEIIAAMTKIHQYTIMCVAITSQMAACEALHSYRSVEEMKKEYRRRREFMVEGLNAIGLSCHKPQGAFYVFPSIKNSGMQALEFAQRLLKEQKVAVVPGTAFGRQYADFVRMSYASSFENLKEALNRIKAFLKSMNPQTFTLSLKMKPKTKADIMKIVKDKKIRYIRLWFTDVLGFLKGFTITSDELPRAMDDGMGFDGSSIEGFARIEESDMIARPDPTTFVILSSEFKAQPVARMFCDIYKPDGKPFPADPRYVLKKNLQRAEKLGFSFKVGPELEYFYFNNPKNTIILDKGGYFDLTPLDIAESVRNETVSALEEMGIIVEYSHHEVASSQHEIDLRYGDALAMADNVMTYRLIVKEVAQSKGLHASFMPKPIFGLNGSGMHTHQSLFKGEKNAFFDKDDKYHLSKIAKGYIAGLLKHAPEITAITNQWVNSYKRIIPGYEAPVYICWAQMNRSALIRVPMYKPGKEKSTRVEYRAPDPACNPYLAFSVMLAAGLEGIEKKYELPPPANDNIYHMSDGERERAKIRSLPEDLLDAIRLTEKSDLVRKALGEELFHFFIRNKKMEWDEYKAQVTQYELEKYLPIL